MSDRPPTDDERNALLTRRRRSSGTAPILSADEELDQAALVAEGRRAENELAAMGAASVADLEQAADLRARIRRAEVARDALIHATGHLVDLLADRHATDPEHHDLLVDAGDDALSRAIDRYDATGDLPFSSFARWWVERAMRELSAPLAPPASPDRLHRQSATADPVILKALGHLNDDDCQIIELRLGLNGDEPRSIEELADELQVTRGQAHLCTEKATAKLRHPCTPGDLTHLRDL